VHAGFDHVRGQDRRVRLVGSDGRDDVTAFDGCPGVTEAPALQADAVEVGDQLVGGTGIDIEEMESLDAEQVMEGQRLKLTLRPLPIKAMVLLSGRAMAPAATADMAAVRIAVVMVSSLIRFGIPVSTSASTPKAITVGRLWR
jgi:hypothetical protein